MNIYNYKSGGCDETSDDGQSVDTIVANAGDITPTEQADVDTILSMPRDNPQLCTEMFVEQTMPAPPNAVSALGNDCGLFSA